MTPDRIETGTYALAAAMAGGEVRLTRTRADLIESLLTKMEEAGVEVERLNDGVTIKRNGARLNAVEVTTDPYPGFATDLQAQFMALMTLADGESVIRETIFENRFMHAPELTRLGADIAVSGGEARVRGVERLIGAPVMATDLRASVGLVIAALAARGETVVNRVYHLDRGFERLEEKLSARAAPTCAASATAAASRTPNEQARAPAPAGRGRGRPGGDLRGAAGRGRARSATSSGTRAAGRFTLALNRYRWEVPGGLLGNRVRAGPAVRLGAGGQVAQPAPGAARCGGGAAGRPVRAGRGGAGRPRAPRLRRRRRPGADRRMRRRGAGRHLRPLADPEHAGARGVGRRARPGTIRLSFAAEPPQARHAPFHDF